MTEALSGADVPTIGPERIPLRFPDGFSTRAVMAVMTEKFGLRGLRIAAMIGFMVGYLWWKGCSSIPCALLYGFAVLCLVFFAGVVWAAKDALDKFVARHQGDAWLIVDEAGIGGEARGERFQIPWEGFRRIVARRDFWLLETRQGGWMVLPTTAFTARAWTLFRQKARNR
ncbi:MAG TPA: YcxB family protein [Usitatibacteraceae bacterium]